MRNTGLYVYAIIPAEGLSTSDLPKGINGQSLHLVETEGLAAIVHNAEPEPYQGPDSDVKTLGLGTQRCGRCRMATAWYDPADDLQRHRGSRRRRSAAP